MSHRLHGIGQQPHTLTAHQANGFLRLLGEDGGREEMEKWTAVDDVRDERGRWGNGGYGGQLCRTEGQTSSAS